MTPRSQRSLRYRFATMEQARAHVHPSGERRLFFFADPSLALAAGSPVTLEWTFASGDQTRLLHGLAAETVPDGGVWIDLLDPRPLRDLGPENYTRRSRRLATHLEISVAGQPERARMLDLSQGGARLTGVRGATRGRELRLSLAAEGAEQPLGLAIVSWSGPRECGVRFDRRDTRALLPLLKEIKDGWARAASVEHPAACCRERGALDPPIPSSGGAADTRPPSPPDPSRPPLPEPS